ncbi:ComEC family competence protein [Candidatus Parcubacteria bacterium]|nr:MAG: ComEC family competence protein [Candidatus Parcubacteria bacterium]
MSKSKIFLLVSLVFLSANFVWLMYFDNQEENPDFMFDKFYTFEAVVKNTDKKLAGYNVLVAPKDLANFSGRIIIYTDLYPEYHYGDVLQIKAKVYRPEPIEDETGKIFRYDKYLAKDDIFAVCFRPQIKVLDQEKDWYFYVYKLRQHLWNNLDKHLVEPASSLAKAMLLGTQREFAPEIRAIFSQVGLSHIIAISGSHMVIIVWLIQAIFLSFGFNRKSVFFFLLISLTLYLALIGFLPPALRSSLMVIICLLGPFLGRLNLSVYSLIFVADIMIILNPYLLLYDLGFQLSFLSVLGLIYYSHFFAKLFLFLPDVFKIREVLVTTLSAQFFIWPLILYHFGILSLVSPVANFLVLPLSTMILIFNFLLAIFGSINFLATLISWPLFILFKLMVEISKFLANLPFAYLNISDFNIYFLIICYLFLVVITLILKPQDYE